MKKKRPTPDDERRDKRRRILMPIENERRRGRDRRKTWELVNPSDDKDPLPMARLSDPGAHVLRRTPDSGSHAPAPAVGVPSPAREVTPPSTPAPPTPPAPPRVSPAAILDPLPAPTHAEAPRATAPVRRPTPSPAVPPPPEKQAPASKAKRATGPRVAPTQPQLPSSPSGTPDPEPGSKPAKKKKTKAPSSRRKAKAKAKPKPRPASDPTTPQTEAAPRVSPKLGTAVADGELWIGVPSGSNGDFLTANAAETHRFVGPEPDRRVVTLCHGPVGTLYRAWRPLAGDAQLGRLEQIEERTYQQIGSEHQTSDELTRAYETIFEAFPEIRAHGLKHAGEVVTIDL